MADNVVAGVVEPPAPGDVEPLPTPGTAEYAEVERRGADALRRGEVGLACWPAAWRPAWAAS